MVRFKNYKALARAVGVVSAVVVVVSGVTFAALQSQQNVLAGNTIATATANLQLSTDGTTFSSSPHSGFSFSNLIPGGSPQPVAGYPVYLQNSGGTALDLKLAVISTPANPDNVDLGKVNVLLTTYGSGNPVQSFSLQSLIAGAANGGVAVSGQLNNGVTQQYKLQVSMDSNATSGTYAAMGNIDLAFSGVVPTN